ncbi:hypothetical protein [Reinekea sp. G2M2-21]|uniref:hypothetical protein n=1 Tax=Reinekea sp. G2M2-21 TaxID=2788942 RepID=UPI0018AA489C|nr:hypothetical protein [Reinekea sp. G2M2-21]
MKNQGGIQLIELLSGQLSYQYEAKEQFHRIGKSYFRDLAKRLSLSKSDFRLSSNKAGIAVSGEITLHTDKFYLQLSQSYVSYGNNRHDILLRTVKDRSDYAGGPNCHLPTVLLADADNLARYIEHHIDFPPANTTVPSEEQVRSDLAHARANEVLTPELEVVRDQYEYGDIDLEDFEAAVALAKNSNPVQLSFFA